MSDFVSILCGPLCMTSDPPEDVKPLVGERWRGVVVRGTYTVRGSDGAEGLLIVSEGSVVNFEGDAMVNAANEGCLFGGGVDGAISRAGGDALARAREALPICEGTRDVRCPTGEARMTIGGLLPTPYCIHAVGPDYNSQMSSGASLADCDALVTSAYKSALKCAQEKRLASVAFSLLSAGIFRGPQSLENVLRLGVLGIREGWYAGLAEVHLVAFTQAELTALKDVCSAVLSGPPADLGPDLGPGRPDLVIALQEAGVIKEFHLSRKVFGVSLEEGRTSIKALPKGSYAQQLGVTPGMVFTAIDGVDLTKLDGSRAADYIRKYITRYNMAVQSAGL